MFQRRGLRVGLLYCFIDTVCFICMYFVSNDEIKIVKLKLVIPMLRRRVLQEFKPQKQALFPKCIINIVKSALTNTLCICNTTCLYIFRVPTTVKDRKGELDCAKVLADIVEM